MGDRTEINPLAECLDRWQEGDLHLGGQGRYLSGQGNQTETCRSSNYSRNICCEQERGILTHSSKWQRTKHEVHDNVVDGDTTAGCAINHPFDELRREQRFPGQQRLQWAVCCNTTPGFMSPHNYSSFLETLCQARQQSSV